MIQGMFALLARLCFAEEPAPADDPAPAPAESTSAPAPVDAPPIDLTEAERARELDLKELKKFKPSRNLLPQNPRGQTDYTAYTLEWGEVELGLTYVSIGVLPGVQVSTVPALYLPPLVSMGQEPVLSPVYNVQAKVDALRLGPWDLAPQANFYSLDWDFLDARFLSFGAMNSLVLAKPWSIHFGAYYSMFNVDGLISEDWILQLLGGVAGGDIGASMGADTDGVTVAGDLQTLTVRLATDVRFNRRDSLVLQAQGLVWTSARFNSTIQQDGKSATLLDKSLAGLVDPTQAYLATLSYQATFRNVDLRIGIGVPFDNPAWALQAFELAYRFGGPTRAEERKLQKGYRENKAKLAVNSPTPPS